MGPLHKSVLRIQGKNPLVSDQGGQRKSINVDFEGEITFFHFDLYFLRILFPFLISKYKFRIEGADISDEERESAQEFTREDLLPKVKERVRGYLNGRRVLAPILIGG